MVRLTERVPVSEVEKVRIELIDERTTPAPGGEPARPDEDGFIRWDVQLAAFGHAAVSLRWVLRKHDDVQGL